MPSYAFADGSDVPHIAEWTSDGREPFSFTSNLTAPVEPLAQATLRTSKVHQYYAELFGLRGSRTVDSTPGADVLAFLARPPDDLAWGSDRATILLRCRRIAGDNELGIPLYWPRQRAARATPGALPETEWDGFGPPYWWIGPSPGGIHFDRVDTILSQIRGTKRVLVWPPSTWRDFYPNPRSSPMPHHSRIGPWHASLEVMRERFPDALRHQPGFAVMTPGTSLYIPTGWLHAVIADPPSLSLTHSRAPAVVDAEQAAPLVHALRARRERRTGEDVGST